MKSGITALLILILLPSIPLQAAVTEQLPGSYTPDISSDSFITTLRDLLSVLNLHYNQKDLIPLDPQSSASAGEAVRTEPCIRIFPIPFRHVTRMEPSIPFGVQDGNPSISIPDDRLARTLFDPGESCFFIWNGIHGQALLRTARKGIL